MRGDLNHLPVNTPTAKNCSREWWGGASNHSQGSVSCEQVHQAKGEEGDVPGRGSRQTQESVISEVEEEEMERGEGGRRRDMREKRSKRGRSRRNMRRLRG